MILFCLLQVLKSAPNWARNLQQLQTGFLLTQDDLTSLGYLGGWVAGWLNQLRCVRLFAGADAESSTRLLALEDGKARRRFLGGLRICQCGFILGVFDHKAGGFDQQKVELNNVGEIQDQSKPSQHRVAF